MNRNLGMVLGFYGLLVASLGCSGGDSAGAQDAGAGGAVGSSQGGDASDSGALSDARIGVGDAGSPDSGSRADGDAGVGVDGGGCSGLSYCDDFEGYGGAVLDGTMLGPWKATVSATGITMTVDTVKPYQGNKALHIAASGASSIASLHQGATGGLVPGNDLFGRAMVFYSNASGDGLPNQAHWLLFNAAGTSTAGGVSMNLGGFGSLLDIDYQPPPPGTESAVQAGALTAGVWHCFQWQYDGSGTPAADDAKLWVDGQLVVQAPQSKGWSFATPWTSFDFGLTFYGMLANPIDLYLDDFALDGSMVGCP